MSATATNPTRASQDAPTIFERLPALPLHLSAATLGSALLLGIAGDALLRDGPAGLGFPVWVSLIAMTVISLAWRADLPVARETKAWLAVSVVFAVCVAWRNSEELQVFDLMASLGAGVLACASMNRAGSVLFAPRLRDSFAALLPLAQTGITGVAPLALQQLSAREGRVQPARYFASIGKVIVIAGTLLLLFGSLLRSADPIFASLLKLPAIDFGTIASHLFVIGILTWITGALGRTALLEKGAPRLDVDFGLPRLGRLEIATALVTLNVLFAAFVATQLGWFFGGEAFLRARTGLTASAYARQGFFQMLFVVLLVVPLLVGTRSVLRPSAALARLHTMLSLPITGLLGAIIVSALLRMRLYVSYFGLTTDRFYPLVFMGWLGVVLVWLALTVLRGWSRPFVGGVAITGLLTLAGLNVVAPDRIIARINLTRGASASTESTVDLSYLSRLGGEGAPLVVPAVLADKRPVDATPTGRANAEQRCWSAVTLLRKWGPTSRAFELRKTSTGWRAWNAGDAAGFEIVNAHVAELQAIAEASCQQVVKPPREYQNTQR